MSNIPVDSVYAVLAAMAYENGRDEGNLLAALRPNGAISLSGPGNLTRLQDDATGFEASAFAYNDLLRTLVNSGKQEQRMVTDRIVLPVDAVNELMRMLQAVATHSVRGGGSGTGKAGAQ